MAGCVEDPTKLGEIMPVFGDDRFIDDDLTEEDGRRWNDHGPQWVGKEGKNMSESCQRYDIWLSSIR